MTPKRTKEFLDREYNEKNKSLADIAKECGTYPNKIRRELIYYKIPLRNKSDAQKMAIELGRTNHPTKGTKRPTATKEKIGEQVSASWKSIDKEERERRSNIARKQWDEMSEEQKESFRSKAAKAVRYAAEHGSKTEQYLNIQLKNNGYHVEFHKEGLVSNEALQIDLYLPDLKTAIEVDGPTHFLPIWGEENLIKHEKADQHKNGLLITGGYNVIRVKIMVKNVSHVFHKKILLKILDALKYIEENPNLKVEQRLIEIDVK